MYTMVFSISNLHFSSKLGVLESWSATLSESWATVGYGGPFFGLRLLGLLRFSGLTGAGEFLTAASALLGRAFNLEESDPRSGTP